MDTYDIDLVKMFSPPETSYNFSRGENSLNVPTRFFEDKPTHTGYPSNSSDSGDGYWYILHNSVRIHKRD